MFDGDASLAGGQSVSILQLYLSIFGMKISNLPEAETVWHKRESQESGQQANA